ncbi:enoyl-CoA hydratase/isomerase [Natrialba hulunbeirensis JCM 10989]|uniref:Enoyl-CoA hydratase/isomerase n=1 Tax=Natrialba hulunbeirensis JCM 10989 TaxID=1227493 RepID=L9ZV68_9EURY|nr:enoyl-CoA hydratase-related protein [Natrialba hulunbeirensis]ELY89472.1 enoyl-CoA hydratase/isomerase [Natrialba hulunbeirensis JCM 10989]
MSEDASGLAAVGKELELVSVSVGEHAEKVATIAIERPDARNALNGQVRTELKEAVAAAEDDDAVRVLVLTGGEGSGAFVAGADVTEFKDRSLVEQREASERPRVYETVDDASIPVIARINGHALGGGCELAQACDVRIASEGSKLGQPEINLGLIPGGGGTQRLARLVGEGQAMRLILSGELIDAQEAHEIGLVDEVYDADDLDEGVYDLAESMAAKSPIALEFAKDAVKAGSRMGLEEGLDYESELFVQLFATKDKDEGIEAFLEKREPEFTGE